ncbi:MAG: hypothetical protein J6S29_01750, partial [Methanosphaera sp.]|nr:hypothetical protein [Methanosphaera sp.]
TRQNNANTSESTGNITNNTSTNNTNDSNITNNSSQDIQDNNSMFSIENIIILALSLIIGFLAIVLIDTVRNR